MGENKVTDDKEDGCYALDEVSEQVVGLVSPPQVCKGIRKDIHLKCEKNIHQFITGISIKYYSRETQKKYT